MTTLRDLSYMIEANTSGLNKALPALDKLSTSLERLERSITSMEKRSAQGFERMGASAQRQARDVTRGADQVKAALQRQEAAIISAKSRMLDLNAAVKAAGGDSRLLANNTRAFNVLERQLKNASTSAGEAAIAKAKFSNALANSRRELTAFARQQKLAEQTQRTADAALLKQSNTLERVRIKYQNLNEALQNQGASRDRILALGNAFQEFETKLQGGVLTAKEFADANNKMNSQIDKAKKSTGIARLSGQMSNLASSAQVALGPLSGVASRITAITSLASRSNIAIAAVIGSVIAFGAAMGQAIRIGSRYEQQMHKINAVLEVTGNRMGTTASEIDEISRRVARNTMTTQTMARDAAASLLTVRAASLETFESALMAAQGLSLIGEGNIHTNIKRIARVLEDPAANLSALAEAGIFFNAVERERITLLQQAGRMDEARAAVMERLKVLEAAATGETMGLAGAWDSLKESLTDFVQESAVGGGVLGVLTSAIKDMTTRFDSLGGSTHLAQVLGDAYRMTAEGLTKTLGALFVIMESLAAAWAYLSSLEVAPWIEWLADRANFVGRAIREVGWALEQLNEITGFLDKSADATGNTTTSLAEKIRELNDAISNTGKQGGENMERFQRALRRANSMISDAIVAGEKPLIDMSVLQEAMDMVNAGQIKEAADKLEAYFGTAKKGVQTVGQLSKELEYAAEQWVTLKQEHLSLLTEQDKMNAQLDNLTRNWDGMKKVLMDSGQSAEQAEASLRRLREEIELNTSSAKSFINGMEKTLEMMKRDIALTSATGSEKRRLQQEQRVLDALWQSGIVTSANYQQALEDLRIMGFGALADEVSRLSRAMEEAEYQNTIASMQKTLEDNIKLMREEVALAGASEAERAIGLEIVRQKQLMVNAGVKEGSAEWERQLALVRELANLGIQKSHVESVKALKDMAAEQDRVLQTMFYAESTRGRMLALAEKEYELLQKYGSLQDARAQKEMEIFKIIQERQRVMQEWQQVADVIEDAFKGLEDATVEWIKTGEFNWQKFASKILEDIFRMTYRMVVLDPLQNLIGGMMGKVTGQGGPGALASLGGAAVPIPMPVTIVGGAGGMFGGQEGAAGLLRGGFGPQGAPEVGGTGSGGLDLGPLRGSLNGVTTQANELSGGLMDLGNGIQMTEDAFDHAQRLVAEEAAKVGQGLSKGLGELRGPLDNFATALPKTNEAVKSFGNIMNEGTQNFSKVLNLSSKDIDMISKVGYTELAHKLKNLNPEQYAKQMQGYVDTVLNRVASPQFPNTVEGVLNQRRAFSKITGPASLNPYGSVANTPSAPEWFDKRIEGYLNQRAMGMPSSIGGNVNYLNPKHSSWNNIKPGSWGDSVVKQAQASGQVFGQGNMTHFHGTAPGYTPAAPYGLQTPGVPQGAMGTFAQPQMPSMPTQPSAFAPTSTFGGGTSMFSGGGMGGGDAGLGQLSASVTQANSSFMKLNEGLPDMTSNLTSGLEKAASSAESLADNGLSRASSGLTRLADDTLQQSIQSQVQSAAQTQQMGTQSMVASTQIQQLGSAAMTAAAQMQMGGGGGILGAMFHGGGVVGGGGTPVATGGNWAGVPRLHGGLRSGEFRAILKRDEGVFTPEQMDALGAAVARGGGAEDEEGGPGRRRAGGGVAVHLHGIKDYDSFRRSQSQLNAGVMSAIRQASDKQG